jgi:acyl-CoA thioesterase-1
MQAKYSLWTAIVSGLVACSAGEESAAERAADPTGGADSRPVVLFVGTSLTAGYGLDPDEAFPALIQRKIDSAGLRFRVVNAGVSGETSAGALRRMDWLFEREPPAVVVIETGANDGLRGQNLDSLRQNLEAIIARVRALDPAPHVVLLAMEALPNMGRDYVTRFRAVYPEVARATGVTLIPFFLVDVAGVDSLNQPDGIHPTRQGQALVTERVWVGLEPVLREVEKGRERARNGEQGRER